MCHSALTWTFILLEFWIELEFEMKSGSKYDRELFFKHDLFNKIKRSRLIFDVGLTGLFEHFEEKK